MFAGISYPFQGILQGKKSHSSLVMPILNTFISVIPLFFDPFLRLSSRLLAATKSIEQLNGHDIVSTDKTTTLRLIKE